MVMKFFSSVRFMLSAVVVVLLLQVLAWLFLESKFSLFVVFLVTQLLIGFFAIWIVARQQRTNTALQNKLQQSDKRDQASAKHTRSEINKLAKIIELNTTALRQLAQQQIKREFR